MSTSADRALGAVLGRRWKRIDAWVAAGVSSEAEAQAVGPAPDPPSCRRRTSSVLLRASPALLGAVDIPKDKFGPSLTWRLAG
ncbi:MAG: hypothetical protein M3500_15295 [Actinomycetota bacterium]|nr:hypothetical protein [Actinomycetota bacterium]